MWMMNGRSDGLACYNAKSTAAAAGRPTQQIIHSFHLSTQQKEGRPSTTTVPPPISKQPASPLTILFNSIPLFHHKYNLTPIPQFYLKFT